MILIRCYSFAGNLIMIEGIIYLRKVYLRFKISREILVFFGLYLFKPHLYATIDLVKQVFY